MRYKAVIFDLFGTLVDNFSSQDFERSLSEMAAAVCVPHAEFARLWVGTFHERMTGVLSTVEANIEHICRTLGLQPDPVGIASAVSVRHDFTRRTLRPRPDAVETLWLLKTAGLRTGLISNCSSEVPALWRETPFAALVDVAVFSCLEGLRKPDRQIYQTACERLSVSPGDCLFVGDGGAYELSAAAEVGMLPVLIQVPYEDPARDPYRREAKEWQGADHYSVERGYNPCRRMTSGNCASCYNRLKLFARDTIIRKLLKKVLSENRGG